MGGWATSGEQQKERGALVPGEDEVGRTGKGDGDSGQGHPILGLEGRGGRRTNRLGY